MFKFNNQTPSANLRRPKGSAQEVKSQLIYSPEHARFVRDHIGRLLRVVCIRMGITNAEFDRRHTLYWESFGGGNKNPNAMTSQKGNLVKSIEPEAITWKAFMKFAEMILRLDIVNVTITVRDDANVVRTFSSDDPLTDVSLTPKPPEEEDDPIVDVD